MHNELFAQYFLPNLNLISLGKVLTLMVLLCGFADMVMI